jgi:hypothetical protein
VLLRGRLYLPSSRIPSPFRTLPAVNTVQLGQQPLDHRTISRMGQNTSHGRCRVQTASAGRFPATLYPQLGRRGSTSRSPAVCTITAGHRNTPFSSRRPGLPPNSKASEFPCDSLPRPLGLPFYAKILYSSASASAKYRFSRSI